MLFSGCGTYYNVEVLKKRKISLCNMKRNSYFGVLEGMRDYVKRYDECEAAGQAKVEAVVVVGIAGSEDVGRTRMCMGGGGEVVMVMEGCRGGGDLFVSLSI